MNKTGRNIINGLLLFSAAAILSSSSCKGSEVNGTQLKTPELSIDRESIEAPSEASVHTLTITSDIEWGVGSSAADWCSVSPSGGLSGTHKVKVNLAENLTRDSREAILTFRFGSGRKTVTVIQDAKEEGVRIPSGYTLVWQDEFNTPGSSTPDTDLWWFETGDGGWGNHELQDYVAGGKYGSEKLAEVSGGTLKITARRIDGKVRSVRMNTKESWTYGYFEASLKLPKGKGTWPAFWMMPKNFKSWPDDGEIDIMEEVGYHPEYVSSSIHCKAYNHPNNTQKTHEFKLAGAQSEFHTYAVEWTPDEMIFIFDGKEHFRFKNDGAGDYGTWPFFNPFYLKLNLAWGGDWGGAEGVDESCLPATFEVDYVRVFQKK